MNYRNHAEELDAAVISALEITAAMPYRVALAKIAGTAAADFRIIAALSGERQIELLCETIERMREIADAALGTEQKKQDDYEWHESHTRDESREGDA